MSNLIEAEQKVKNLEPTRQQNRGLSDENKAINMYVHAISSYKHHPYMYYVTTSTKLLRN